MRTMWKGYLKVSLVTIPIKMFNATTRGRSIQFNQLHQECNSRIKQEKVCPKCDKRLTNEDIVKGYQYGKDMYVIITDEDLEKAKKESTDSIEILKFVDDDQIHPIYYYDSHYLAPDGKVGVESFALFHKAMEATKKSALAKVVIRNKEQLLSIRPYNGTLIAYTLHYPEEIQDAKKVEYTDEVEKLELNEANLEMAKAIIENLSGDFVPEEHVDEYAKTLMQIVTAKAEGEEVKIAPRVEEGKVINLMDALEQSVKATKVTKMVPKKKMARAGKKVKKPVRKRKKA